jgi:hypothetical protein
MVILRPGSPKFPDLGIVSSYFRGLALTDVKSNTR